MGEHIRLNKRQQDILSELQRAATATVEALAAQFGVTQQTIRRDVLHLESLGLVSRFHGGVGLPIDAENITYSARQRLFSAEKRRIAEMVAEHIPDGASVFVNLGTTAEAVANALYRHRGLRVITNNLNVASAMCDFPAAEVILAGGVVRPRDRGVTGDAAIELISQFTVDYAVIGVSSVALDGTLRDFDYREVQVTQAIMSQSRRVFLVADHSKIGRPALVRLGHVREVDSFFTDEQPPAELAALFSAGRPALLVAARVD